MCRLPRRAAHPYVALDAGRGRLSCGGRAVKAVDVEPELSGAVPEVGVLEAAQVRIRGVGERPEGTLGGGRLGGVGERERARVAALQRQVAEDDPGAGGIVSQLLVRDRAMRAREVGVEHDEPSIPADVIVVADAGHRRAAQVLHTGSLAAMEDLEADGIRIRRFRDTDAAAFAAGTHDPEVAAHSGLAVAHTPQSALAVLEELNAVRGLRAARDRRRRHRRAARHGDPVQRRAPRAALRGRLLAPTRRARTRRRDDRRAPGVRLGDARVGHRALRSHSDIDNPGAHAVLERNGFAREGLLPGWARAATAASMPCTSGA